MLNKLPFRFSGSFVIIIGNILLKQTHSLFWQFNIGEVCFYYITPQVQTQIHILYSKQGEWASCVCKS